MLHTFTVMLVQTKVFLPPWYRCIDLHPPWYSQSFTFLTAISQLQIHNPSGILSGVGNIMEEESHSSSLVTCHLRSARYKYFTDSLS